MKESLVQLVAPLVRGLSFDGEKADIVSSFSPAADVEGPAEASPLFLAIADGDPETVIESYRRHCDVSGTAPRFLLLPDRSYLVVGESYDRCRRMGEAFAGDPAAAIETAAGESAAQPEAGPDGLARGGGSVVAGKVAVVTGGAQGFGEQIVRQLAAAGAIVAIADLNLEGAERLAADLNATHGETVAFAVTVNVGDEASVSSMVSTIVAKVGGIDLFVSNAGVLKAGSVKELDLADFEMVMKVNHTGFFLCVKHVAPVLALQNRPSSRYYTDIIQINSKTGLEGSNRNGAYAGSKFGGIGLTQSFALELVVDNIKVNAICPGNFFEGPLWSDPERGLFVQYLRAGKVPGAETVADVRRAYEEKVPMKRGCTGEDVVKAIYYIVDQKYETGQALPVTGGQVMLR